MSKKLFTEEEIIILKQNKYVKKVTSKGITYTDEFKRIFIDENGNGKLPRIIFEECGFNIDIIGMQRVKSSASRWRTAFKNGGAIKLTDTRKYNTGRPIEKDLSIEEKYKKLEAKMKLLQAENELPKKVRYDRKESVKEEVSLFSCEKYEIIKSTIKKYKLKNMISYLCKVAGVSRSGYYKYFSSESKDLRKSREDKDILSKENVLKAFNFKGRKKGARQIKMVLKDRFNIIYNLKRIRRIMKKYGIVCPYRKANPYRRMMKASKEHTIVSNFINREFKQDIPYKVLLTDITYLSYKNGKKAYLSTIKDSSTNEILAHYVSDNLRLDIVLNTLEKLKSNVNLKLHSEAILHSDQGVHYTSPKFQKQVQQLGLKQSMSRRGNCWDNAPQESFFGHFKDEVILSKCSTLEEVIKEIDDYMDYYNNYRYQWNLSKMTPVQYRNHLVS
ncbi:IS3 family transposase [Romboutsia timonensis]|uniref:IS3 family transposase n=2 Tax=Bacteria TaxID=2 RepID=UPI00115FC1A9|nr:IS3 family transposase [Romboutsia timonensis]MEE0712574.1 IS3 family transposase [Romboutsia timonensis]HNK91163.1 IS3 family transposase [Chitinophagales bacterium]